MHVLCLVSLTAAQWFWRRLPIFVNVFPFCLPLDEDVHGPLFKQTFYQKCLLPNLIEPSGSGEEDEDEKNL